MPHNRRRQRPTQRPRHAKGGGSETTALLKAESVSVAYYFRSPVGDLYQRTPLDAKVLVLGPASARGRQAVGPNKEAVS